MVQVVRKSTATPEVEDIAATDSTSQPATNMARGMAVVEPSDMPSKFLPYPKGTTIFYRPYTFDEIEVFNDSMMSETERMAFINEGIICKGIDHMQLTLSDWLYLGMLRKLSVFESSKFSVTIPPDPETNRNAHTVLLEMAKMGVTDLEVPALPAVVTVDGQELHFSPMTLERFNELSAALKEEATANGEDKARLPTSREVMAYQCINRDPAEILPTIKGAMGQEYLDLQELDLLFRHRVNPVEVKWKVGEQEYSELVEIDNPTSLVWPFRGQEESRRSTIRFGLPGAG